MEKVRLGDIYSISSGGTLSRKDVEYYSGGTINWVKPGDLKKKYIEETEEKITDKGLYNSSTKMYNPGTVLIAMYGATIGETSILNIKACTNQACAAFVKNNKVIPEYLYYFFKSNKEKFVNAGIGGAQPNISIGYLKNVIFNLYEIFEQEKIVDKLNKLEEIIDFRKKQIEELDELIKSQFVELFGDNKFSKTKICNIIDTNIIKTKKRFKIGEKIKYIDISSIDNLKNEIIRYTEYSVGEEPSRAQQCINQGDIIISTVRPNLKNVAINKFEYDNVIASSGFCVLRAKDCLKEYLLEIVKSDEFTADMVSLTTGANYPAIHTSDILNYEVMLPPIELQNQFAELVKQIDKQKFIIEKSLKETEELQESLMNKYFGE